MADLSKNKRVLDATELLMIEQWVVLAESLGVPRSYGQIYGLCFISNKPVSAQDCVDALCISRSSAGQGLRFLREVGAIRSNFKLGSRVETYLIEPDLGQLVASVVRGKLAPAFDQFFKSMDFLQTDVEQRAQKNELLVSRFQKLKRWKSKLNEAQQWLLR